MEYCKTIYNITSISFIFSITTNILYLVWMIQAEDTNNTISEIGSNKYLFFEIYFGLSGYIIMMYPIVNLLPGIVEIIENVLHPDYKTKIKIIVSILCMIQRIYFVAFASSIIIKMIHSYAILTFFGAVDFIALSLLFIRWIHPNALEIEGIRCCNCSKINEINVDDENETIIMPYEQCSIRLESNNKHATHNKIECEHIFHKSYIARRLEKDTICPTCKKNII